MGTLEVVDFAPAVEGRLGLSQAVEAPQAKTSAARLRWKRSILPRLWG